MVIEPGDLWALVEKTHEPHIAQEVQAYLLLRTANWSYQQIGDRYGRSESAVRRDVERVQDAVFFELGLLHPGWATGAWVHGHRGCCLAEGQQALKAGVA